MIAIMIGVTTVITAGRWSAGVPSSRCRPAAVTGTIIRFFRWPASKAGGTTEDDDVFVLLPGKRNLYVSLGFTVFVVIECLWAAGNPRR